MPLFSKNDAQPGLVTEAAKECVEKKPPFLGDAAKIKEPVKPKSKKYKLGRRPRGRS